MENGEPPALRTRKLAIVLRALVSFVWATAAFVFWAVMSAEVLPWVATLPDVFARSGAWLLTNTTVAVLVCSLFGVASLLVWRRLGLWRTTALALLVPTLLLAGAFHFLRLYDRESITSIQTAAQRGDVQATRDLLVFTTAQVARPHALDAVLRAGGNPNARGPNGNSALAAATTSGLTQRLLDAGAVPDTSALHEAVFWGRLDVLQQLFAATPDNGWALVAAAGASALEDNRVVTNGEQDRRVIERLLRERLPSVGRPIPPIAASSEGP